MPTDSLLPAAVEAIAGAIVGDHIWEHFAPRPKVDTWTWLCEHVRQPNGRPFDGDSYPWGRGFCQAFDDPRIRELVAQWASRLGKTFICQGCAIKTWACNPMPSMFSSSTQSLAEAIVRDKFYKMLEQCEPLAAQLKAPSRRSNHRIELRDCLCRIAWSGSYTSLADFAAWLVHGNEIDKHSTDASDEGDPVELLVERTKEFPDHKILLEGTPARKGKSRVEARRLVGSDSRYHVYCVHCHKAQVLHRGDAKSLRAGGLVFDGMDAERPDPDVAARTARYVCEHCARDIHDEHRARLMRSGLWVPAGCWADAGGKIRGTPKRDNGIFSTQLSSLYSLQLRWGDYAKKWANAIRRPALKQNFINSWDGETYEESPSLTPPDQLGARLTTKDSQPMGTVPDGVAFLTVGIDKQKDHVVYQVWGWGPDEQGKLVDYGERDSEEDVFEHVIATGFRARRLDHTFRPALTFIDSGYRAKDVYAFVKRRNSPQTPILPIKGVDHLKGLPYKRVTLTARKNRKASAAAAGESVVLVSNDFWQPALQRALETLKPGQPGSIELPLEGRDDIDLAEQLLNECESEQRNSRGYSCMIWTLRDEHVPNDHRDAFKMARCAAEYFLRRNWRKIPAMLAALELPPAAQKAPPRPEREPFVRRPKGGFRFGGGARFGRRRED